MPGRHLGSFRFFMVAVSRLALFCKTAYDWSAFGCYFQQYPSPIKGFGMTGQSRFVLFFILGSFFHVFLAPFCPSLWNKLFCLYPLRPNIGRTIYNVAAGGKFDRKIKIFFREPRWLQSRALSGRSAYCERFWGKNRICKWI